MGRQFYSCIFALVFVQHYLILASTAIKKTNIATDQSSLLALKAHVTSDPFQLLSKNWSSSAATSSVCNWIGVECGSKHRRVTSLNISGMELTGTIPSEVGNLSFLVSLDMRRNYFHGNMPEELSRLRRLRFISLSSNNFTGEIPMWFGHFPKLQILALYKNNFNGPIPSSISNLSKLEHLNFGSNSLRGKIPEEIGNLHSLKLLNLQHNELVGCIPLTMFNISTLEYVAFTFNNLSGTLPVDICHHLPNLKGIYLSFNQIHGQIPPSLSQCSQLQVLSLSYNKFSGRIPKDIGNLKMLENLDLGSSNLQGVIPAEIGNLLRLKQLGIEKNHITGSIPREIGNLTMLNELIMSDNSLTGQIPPEICNLHKLEKLEVGLNRLSGPIPAGIFNLSRLRSIGLEFNSLTGNLPPNMGDRLPNMETMFLGTNKIGGVLPASIANSSRLSILELGFNQFTGPVPNSLGELALLEYLNLSNNSLIGDLEFITSLTKCQHFRFLEVSVNPFHGFLPVSIGNFSTSLKNFRASACGIKGRIPSEIGNLSNLITFTLEENQLTGVIPFAISNLHNLQKLSLRGNGLTSNVDSLCKMHRLFELSISSNRISGPIPDCFGNMTSLRQLYLESNRLSSSIPGSLWELQDLLVLNLSSNNISGFLPPKIQNLKAIIFMDISRNQISGEIPSTLGDLNNLQNLSLAHNHLKGSIPESIGDMLSLTSLDLSHNNLSSLIPKSLEALIYLKRFNVSFNHLRGEIPSGGPFKNFTFESFIFNAALCGAPENHVPRCQPISIHKSKVKKALRITFIVLGSLAIMVVLALTFLYIRLKKNGVKNNGTSLLPVTRKGRVSYYELLHATGEFNDSNLLGSGSFGSVYKGILDDGTFVAVKVFNLQHEGGLKSFDVECEVLRNLRHRNLVKVISSCGTNDFKALVLQYMSNGSLERWLYSHNYFLNILQRLDIMIDVAKALQYLHYEYLIPVIHCDLKPSNILIDEDMTAHVSDFGIAKFLGKEESVGLTKTLATIGYVAPEYGLEGLVSRQSDVYSYGIILLEVFTRRKPNDELFAENMNLRSWVNNAMPDSIHQVIDANMLELEEENLSKRLECLSSLMELALNCVSESPKQRLSIKDVLATLEKIKSNYLACHGGN